MNWEAVGAISEAIGVVAILISLAYLAVQIRQSTREFSRGIEAKQLAAFESNIESGNRIRELLILHPELYSGADDLPRPLHNAAHPW